MLRNALWTTTLALATGGVLAAALLPSGVEVATLLRESGPIENVQAGALLAGCAVFVFATAKAGAAAVRLLFAALALFYLTFTLREIEAGPWLRDLPVLAVLEPPLRNYWLSVLWGILIVFVLLRFRAVLAAFFQWIRPLQGYLIVAGGALYGVAEGLEKRAFPFLPDWLSAYEELPELVAVVLMLSCAALSARWAAARKGASDQAAQQADPGKSCDRQTDERHLDRGVQRDRPLGRRQQADGYHQSAEGGNLGQLQRESQEREGDTGVLEEDRHQWHGQLAPGVVLLARELPDQDACNPQVKECA